MDKEIFLFNWIRIIKNRTLVTCIYPVIHSVMGESLHDWNSYPSLYMLAHAMEPKSN